MSQSKASEAVTRIDAFLRGNARNDAYDRWFDRYALPFSEKSDSHLFSLLVQAMFSGNMNGAVVDKWMPRMTLAFEHWDIERIAGYTSEDLARVMTSGNVIRHPQKIEAVVQNAKQILGLRERGYRFGKYLTSFANLDHLTAALSETFDYIGFITAQDFLRNAGFDTIKPDRHVTRWMKHFGSIPLGADEVQVMASAKEIAIEAGYTLPQLDSIIYLFCSPRGDVIDGAICGEHPLCDACPVTLLCARIEAKQLATEPFAAKRRARSRNVSKQSRKSEIPAMAKTNTIKSTFYSGKTLEEIKLVNPFANEDWLANPADFSPVRRSAVNNLFGADSQISIGRIRSLKPNEGTYAAFRAIAHGIARWDEARQMLIRVS